MKPYIIIASIIAALSTSAATVVPTPVGRDPKALGPGVIVARSAPGYLPCGMTTIRGRDSSGTIVGGPLIIQQSASTLLLPELYANGSVLLPPTSSRHVLWRYEIIK